MPLIIPPDTATGLDMLASNEIRNTCGVVPDNVYLFANTKNSEDHASGWHSLHRIIKKLPLKEPNKIKSTSNRHRISTILASLDISDKDRALFYKHMGHSEKINQTIYQAPATVMEVTGVGKHLQMIDSGNYILLFSLCIKIITK